MKNTLLIILLIFLSGCLGSKSIVENSKSKKTIENTSLKKDSISNTTTKINNEIRDKLVIEVGDSGIDECDDRIDEILSKLNTSKSSGANSYNSRYDRETRQLLIDFIVGETQTKNKTTDINSSFISDKSFEEVVIERSEKVIKIIPWWLWLIIIWMARKQLISIISIVFPAIKGIKTISDLFTPPNN